jgi:hypothetical protein
MERGLVAWRPIDANLVAADRAHNAMRTLCCETHATRSTQLCRENVGATVTVCRRVHHASLPRVDFSALRTNQHPPGEVGRRSD